MLKKEKVLNLIRELWNAPEEKNRDIERIANYHKLKTDENNPDSVDADTWDNLNMNNLFEKMDYNISCFGQQYLYHNLRTYKNDFSTLERYSEKYDIFIKNSQLREKLQAALINLRNLNSYNLANLLFAPLPEKPKYYFVFYLLSFLSFASLIAISIKPVFLFAFILLGLINIAVNWLYSSRMFSHFSELTGLNALLGAAIKLAKCKSDGVNIEQLDVLQKELKTAWQIKKSIGWLIIDKSHLDSIALALVEYLNQFLLFELITFLRSLNKLKKYRKELVNIFEAVASLDAEIAAAAYLNNCGHFCRPVFNNQNSFDFTSVYHPLLEDAVSNDFKINDKSVLITGSNMAGKTTFIKTIGVNLILAKTAGFVLAKAASIPDMKVFASIKRSDDIINGKSYYFAEVEEILKFINKSADGSNYLFLIDEIFKGTNTAERISASKAVLNYLSGNSIALVTTHDIELEDLLKENFEMYNFSEQIKDSQVYFDYKIKQGKCTGRNAIKLLELSGYPKEIINEALAEYETFSHKGVNI
jgi:hypothetical protein